MRKPDLWKNNAKSWVSSYDVAAGEWLYTAVGMGTARYVHAAAVLNEKLYVFGGKGIQMVPQRTVQAYDPVTNAWTDAPSMFGNRYDFDVVALDGHIYAIGGQDAVNSTIGSVYRFTPE